MPDKDVIQKCVRGDDRPWRLNRQAPKVAAQLKGMIDTERRIHGMQSTPWNELWFTVGDDQMLLCRLDGPPVKGLYGDMWTFTRTPDGWKLSGFSGWLMAD